jgi:hypothetical protein
VILRELDAERGTLLLRDLAADLRGRADPGSARQASVESSPGDAGASPHAVVAENHTESVARFGVASETYALNRSPLFTIPANALLPWS